MRCPPQTSIFLYAFSIHNTDMVLLKNPHAQREKR
jgi:hypothetical protein